MIIPPESLQDKIAFTFNNLSQMNLVVKVSYFDQNICYLNNSLMIYKIIKRIMVMYE